MGPIRLTLHREDRLPQLRKTLNRTHLNTRPIAVRYTRSMSAKAELQVVIEAMSDAEAERFLDYINLRNDPDEASPEDLAAHALGKAEIERGEFVWGEDLERELRL